MHDSCVRVLCSLALLVALKVNAAETQDFKIYPTEIKIPERGAVPAYLISWADQWIFFQPPPGAWFSKDEAKKESYFFSKDNNYKVTLRVHDGFSSIVVESTNQLVRLLINRHPESEVTELRQIKTSLGPGISIICQTQGKTRVEAVFLQLEKGMLEITSEIAASKAVELRHVMGTVLGSLESRKRPKND